jgi:hypothetical protein
MYSNVVVMNNKIKAYKILKANDCQRKALKREFWKILVEEAKTQIGL